MPPVRYERENVLGHVTLAHASEANRLTFEMMEELTEALLQAGKECDVMLLRGKGVELCDLGVDSLRPTKSFHGERGPRRQPHRQRDTREKKRRIA